jgi:hypothetical protein
LSKFIGRRRPRADRALEHYPLPVSAMSALGTSIRVVRAALPVPVPLLRIVNRLASLQELVVMNLTHTLLLACVGDRRGSAPAVLRDPKCRRGKSEQAVAIIDSLRSQYAPARGPIIDKIVREWGASRPEGNRTLAASRARRSQSCTQPRRPVERPLRLWPPNRLPY